MIRALVLTLALAGPAAAQGLLPVKLHDTISSFRGDPSRAIAVEGDTVYTLYSAHKEARRPWADAIIVRRAGTEVTYLSRAYDCERGAWRWMGEADEITEISLSVRSMEQLRLRAVQPGTTEYQLARYVCAL